MYNFDYHIPTKIFFGKDQIVKLPAEIKAIATKILLVYGGGSIKRNGIYDTLLPLLKEAGIEVYELSGVEPNPRVTTVAKGAQMCKEYGIEAVLAVGGGSTIDCTKVIAAAAYYDGDPWDLVIRKAPITNALPVFSVLTASATGSEMNNGAVISNMDTNDKLGIGHPSMLPRASVLDPTYTYTTNKHQTAAGTADIMSHTLENYFSKADDFYLLDGMAEAMLKTCIKYGPVALEDPENYEARANLMWTSSLAINGSVRWGKADAWSVHSMEHQLSAYYDITHGDGLAILTPAWMKHILSENTLDRFVKYGVNVWGIDASLDKWEIANRSIDMTQDFFVNSLGIPATLREVGIDESQLEVMAEKASTPALQNDVYVPLFPEDVLAIYKLCLG
ncbi:MAG: iron-containing alcohol dehydrogenase [Lachnospiraceae bacterium]|nr:iron-containing alcohol dehydrogenase [Lachnospiraceae bacterium]MBQ6857690.1 iron-containing alcohol dehydrogenase [Lachnospiraceae bacterium]